MIKMGSTSEITELSEDQEPVQYFRRKYLNSSILKLEDSLEDDLNKLFKAIDLKSSLDSPRMNPSKKPMKPGIPHSPKAAMSDTTSLKQALRGFCLSQASEMAALKRSAKSIDSSAASDVSRMQNSPRIDGERNRGILGISEKKPASPRAGNVISPRYTGRKVQLANKSGFSSASSSPRLPTSITPRTAKSNIPLSFSQSKCPKPENRPKKLSYTVPNGNQLLCQRCQCSINTDKREISQSSKSSVGDYSSSTSVSADSSLGRSSCSNRPHMSKDTKWKAIRRVRSKHGVLSLENFNLLKKLGCGDIGTVYLAELIDSSCLFAIKVMDNEYLDRRKKLGRSQTEKEILKMLDHPFLPTLYSHFSCDNLSCLVMEYCPGGDLHVIRQKQPTRNFSEPAARFYAAEVLLALEYLHMLGVVYRDLKPENILVREDGHIMLTDFDLSLRCTVSPVLMSSSSFLEHAKMMSARSTGSSCIAPLCIEPSCFSAKSHKQKPNTSLLIHSLPQLVAEPTAVRSNSFVGTHEYLAPEIIKGEGHGSAVDWWTFGIFLYELLFGKTPFKGAGNDETLANVVLQGLVFPDNPGISFDAMDLIRGLLVKDPDTRLGSERGAAEIKQHPFFEGLNWALIRCAIPPEVPECYDFAGSLRVHRGLLEVGSAGEHLEFELF